MPLLFRVAANGSGVVVVVFRYYNRSTFSSRSQRMTDAINNVIFYFGHVFNGVFVAVFPVAVEFFNVNALMIGDALIYEALKQSH